MERSNSNVGCKAVGTISRWVQTAGNKHRSDNFSNLSARTSCDRLCQL